MTDNLNDYKLDIFLIMPDNQERLLLTDKNGTVTSYLDENSMIYNPSFFLLIRKSSKYLYLIFLFLSFFVFMLFPYLFQLFGLHIHQ